MISMKTEQALEPEVQTILVLADNMAAAASSFNAHGYDAFIGARSTLIQGLIDLHLEELKRLKEQ